MTRMKYDNDFMQSTIGKALYYKWFRIKAIGCCREWQDDFLAFASWCLDSGYKEGATLKRYDARQVYSPRNCYWAIKRETPTEPQKKYEYPSYNDGAFQALWNKTVNRIREHYGMEPVEVVEPDFTDRTCKDCVHYKVCKYKRDDVPICEDYLD